MNTPVDVSFSHCLSVVVVFHFHQLRFYPTPAPTENVLTHWGLSPGLHLCSAPPALPLMWRMNDPNLTTFFHVSVQRSTVPLVHQESGTHEPLCLEMNTHFRNNSGNGPQSAPAQNIAETAII